MEIITGKHISIIINGKDENEINAALAKSFEFVLAQVKKGRYYLERQKKIGKARVNFGIEERAQHV